MPKLRVETNAFRVSETVRSRNRNITVRQAKTEAMAAAAAELGALSDDVEVFDVTVEFSPGKVALIQVTSSDGTGSRAVAPNRLKEGLTRIFSRESQLERTAALFGLPAEDLLAILAESAVDTTDASAGLPDAERNELQRAGISLDGPEGDPSGAGQVAAGLARSRRFRDEALTIAQAAEALNLSRSRVSQLVSNGDLITMPGGTGTGGGDGSYLLPAWQIVDGQPLPGMRVVAAAASGVHPLTLAGFMTRPNVDLEISGQEVAPVAWLVAGGDPEIVAGLVTGLLVAA